MVCAHCRLSAARWGHAGYKELYPDEFCNTESEPPEETKTKKRLTNIRTSSHFANCDHNYNIEFGSFYINYFSEKKRRRIGKTLKRS